MSDKERREVEQMIKQSMIGGRLSLSKLAELTAARITDRIDNSDAKNDPVTASANIMGEGKYYTDLYTRAQREVLGLVPKSEWHTDVDGKKDFKPTIKLVTMNAPAKFDPDRKIVDQGYLFYDEETAKKIDKAHLAADKLIGDARIFTSMALSPKQYSDDVSDKVTLDDRDKRKIETPLKAFITAAKGQELDQYAKEQITKELADLKKANIGTSDATLGDEIQALNTMLAKSKSNSNGPRR